MRANAERAATVKYVSTGSTERTAQGGGVILAMPALAPVESSELDIAPGLPGEVEVGGVGSTVVGITEVDDEVTIGDEDDAGTEVVKEIVKLVGVALPSVCVVMVEISVVVMRMELRVAEEIVTVVGGSTETTVVVTDEGGSVDFE